MKTLIVIICLVLAALFMWMAQAFAHSWYEPACCSDKDCEPIPDSAVTYAPEGYHVQYVGALGYHVNVVVPFSKAHPSRDEHFHGCATSDRFLCLYAPVGT